MPDGSHVYANLVRPAGLKCAFNERAIDVALDNAIMGSRRLAGSYYRHLDALRRVATNGIRFRRVQPYRAPAPDRRA